MGVFLGGAAAHAVSVVINDEPLNTNPITNSEDYNVNMQKAVEIMVGEIVAGTELASSKLKVTSVQRGVFEPWTWSISWPKHYDMTANVRFTHCESPAVNTRPATWSEFVDSVQDLSAEAFERFGAEKNPCVSKYKCAVEVVETDAANLEVTIPEGSCSFGKNKAAKISYRAL